MSFLNNVFNSLRLSESVGQQKEKERIQREKRDKTIESFFNSFEKLMNHPTIYLTADDISSLDFIVKVEDFQLLNDDTIKKEIDKKIDFFTPMAKETLASYPMNLQSKKMAIGYSYYQKATDEGRELLDMKKRPYLFVKPDIMCSRLRWSVEIVPRMATKNDSKSLEVVTGWRESFGYNFVLPAFEPYLYRRTEPLYGIQTYWTKKGYPHIKMCMSHGNDKPVKYLLLAEFLTIIATICTRLIEPTLQDHAIIPVMIFSFIAPNHGRLILSHFDGSILHIRISETLNFSSKNEEAWETFIRYVAADVNPAADTSTMA